MSGKIDDNVFLKPFKMTIRIKKAEELGFVSLKKEGEDKGRKKHCVQLTRSSDETGFIVAHVNCVLEVNANEVFLIKMM